ncbi:MAG: hypothetical protein CNIPEHKO_03427 [Anaerolineales bacterium]|nr:hypothetical protein [Anaerolineales bacterium]
MISQNISIIRAGSLILFVLALLGPWTFDVINVPAEYECSAPFIRLNGDFCGMPMSGFQFFGLWVGGFFFMLFELIAGEFTGHALEFLMGLSILFLIPFFTTLFLLWKKDARRFRTIHLIACVLALILALVFFIDQINDPIIRLWGLWLYILMAVSVIVIEYLASKNNPASNI